MDTWVSLFTNPKVLTYMRGPVNRSAEEWWVGLHGKFESVDLPLSVTKKPQDSCIGHAGYLEVAGDQSSLEIYCRLLPDFWNKGYGRELCSTLTATALGALKATKVVGYVHPENAASIAILRGLGFRHAGNLDDSKSWQVGHEIYEKTAG
jgi:RimJ/RimL family protein N-acetyltransferase